jgi:hypothetical protein
VRANQIIYLTQKSTFSLFTTEHVLVLVTLLGVFATIFASYISVKRQASFQLEKLLHNLTELDIYLSYHGDFSDLNNRLKRFYNTASECIIEFRSTLYVWKYRIWGRKRERLNCIFDLILKQAPGYDEFPFGYDGKIFIHTDLGKRPDLTIFPIYAIAPGMQGKLMELREKIKKSIHVIQKNK